MSGASKRGRSASPPSSSKRKRPGPNPEKTKKPSAKAHHINREDLPEDVRGLKVRKLLLVVLYDTKV